VCRWDGRSHVFLYLLSEPIGDDFRIFLVVTQSSFVRFPPWSIRLLVPTGVESEVADAYEAVFREELATPLHPTVANELRWFYQSADITGTVDRTRLEEGAPCFRRATVSRYSESLAPGRRPRRRCGHVHQSRGRHRPREAVVLNAYELSRQYFHLSSMVGSA
jgi:hypothetical protein